MSDETAPAPRDNPQLPGLPEPEPDTGPPAFATLVSTDGRLLRLSPEPGGLLTIRVHGGKVPLVLDRWQAQAFRQAVAALPMEGAAP